MTIESEVNNYRLHVTGYHGNAGDAFNDDHVVDWRSNGMSFSTPDVDNDQNPTGHCAKKCGWWYRKCSSSKLNCVAIWYSNKPAGSWYKAIPVSASRMLLQCGTG